MTIEIEIIRQDYADFNKYHFVKTSLTRTIITGVLAIIMVELFLNKDHFDLFATIVSVAAFVPIYALLITWRLQRTKNLPKDGGTILGKKTLQFNDDEIVFSDSDSVSNMKWSTIKSIDEGKNGLYLYVDTNMAIVVPKRFFETKLDQQEFVDYIKSKINRA